MDKSELEAFLAVVRAGSFTVAAKNLNLSQPALSRRIANLETTLGAPLLDRRKGRTVPTDAGWALLPHSEAVLGKFQEGIDAVRAVRHGTAGGVSLAINGRLARPRLIDAVKDFRDRHPAVKLLLRSGRTSQYVSNLVANGEVSMGLRYRVDLDDSLHSRTIGYEEAAVVCAPEHPLANRSGVTPQDLIDETWVLMPSRGEESDQAFSSYLAEFGLKGRHFMAIAHPYAHHSLVRAGFGIGLIALNNIHEELASGRMCKIDVEPMDAKAAVVLVTKKGKQLNEATKRLHDELIALFANM